MTHHRPQEPDVAELAAAVAAGSRHAVATGLNWIDDRRPGMHRRAGELLSRLSQDRFAGDGHIIGLTGPPGVGKSTLSAALIRHWLHEGRSVGVLAVDPSSPISGGALLGDRLRMLAGNDDPRVFIRSLANRGDYGGLSAEVWPMSLVMQAAFDIVLIETVGVGQREIDVASFSDTTCFVLQPQSGDTIQFLKAGIMEVPDVVVVNKADLGIAWQKTVADLAGAIGIAGADDIWVPPVVPTSAAAQTGIADLAHGLADHRAWLVAHGRLAPKRLGFAADWVLKRLDQEFGRRGLARLGGEAAVRAEVAASPTTAFEQLDRFSERLGAATPATR
ncbi:MAG: methylmalonyl Co-A mutase-associated GTPase MeaB [Rhodospirillaceae bacterium]|nr:methylmalonyl Co-A mutase-associated GTPase MeaB [Rhodospirillaceae bacterium]